MKGSLKGSFHNKFTNFYVMNVNSSVLLCRQELELDSSMASLDICEDNEENNASKNLPQVDNEGFFECKLRPRQPSSSDSKRKRRCQLKPTKLNGSLASDNSDCYVNNNIQKSTTKLETIFEEPMAFKNGRVKHMGCSKSRKVQFSGITKTKMKHRRSKMKKMNSCRVRIKRKVNMNEFIARFHELMGTKETNETFSVTDVNGTSFDVAPSIS